MNFINFRDFYNFIFDLKPFFFKRGLDFARVPRGCDVALRATWQRHAGPRGAYAAYTLIYSLYSLYNGYSAFRISEGYSNPLKHCIL